MGGADYIIKPFIPSELVVRVNNHLQQKKSQDIIKEQAAELKLVNDAKDRVFSIISHDLRSPFASLQMILNHLNEIDLIKQENSVKEMITLMNILSTEINQLLDNLLNWSRKQMERTTCIPVKFDLNTVIQQNIKLFASSLKKNISIDFKGPDEINVFADDEMIKAVMRNLLSNAIKFSFPGKEITIQIEKIEKLWTIAISNIGATPAKNVLDNLFSNNEYYSTPGTQGEKGTGFGLKICHAFVEINGGTIWAQNEHADHTTFYFTVPVAS